LSAAPLAHQRGVPAPNGGLAGHDVLGFDDELRGTVGARWLDEHGTKGRVVTSTNSLLSQAAAVEAGLGVRPLPCVVRGDVTPRLQRFFFDVIGHHDIRLVVHPDVRTSARVRATMEFLTALIQAEAPLLAGERPTSRGTFRGRRDPPSGAKHRGAAQKREGDRPAEQRGHRAHRRLGAEPHE